MRTIAVTSGKGGVGKSNLSANLSITLAARGHKTVVFDADLGLANLDVILGARAAYTLQHVLTGEKRVAEVVSSGPGGIGFIAGGSGVTGLMNLSGPQLDRFLSELAEIEDHTDFLVFDTGAGIDDAVLTFCEASDEVIVVATPDPASIADAYATIKVLLGRKSDAVVQVVVNMVSSHAQGESVFAKLNQISVQFLKQPLKLLGCIRADDKAVQAIRARKPYSLEFPGAPATQDVEAIAARVCGRVVDTPSATLVDRLKSVFGFTLKRSA
jgi:flagellar biosynthesis protein FlhG